VAAWIEEEVAHWIRSKIGDVDVPVKLYRDVTATVKVRVVAET